MAHEEEDRGKDIMYLGIDCGTQGTKALLLDENGVVHGRGYARHALIEKPTGAREQEPPWWVEAMRTAVTQAVAAAPREEGGVGVRALGVSGQQHGLVVLDETFAVIRPAKLWNDTETAQANADLIAHFGGKAAFFERFGIVPLTGYTASKLVWMAQQEKENFARIRHVLLPHEYLNFWLTGKLRAECGDASGTAYFDVRTRAWIPAILDAIDAMGGCAAGHLQSAVPEIVGPDAIVGKLKPEVARELGVSPECAVSAGGGDNMMGAIGTGNVREGLVTLSLGTSSTVYSFSSKPTTDASGSVAPFCSSSGGWLPLVCTMNATNVVTGTVELLGKTVAAIEPALQATPPGAEGLVFLPFLNGERTPDLPHAQGSLHGISAVNFSPDALVRAVVEGVSFGILNGLDLVLDGRAAETITVIGGGARSEQWRQLLADATGAVVTVPQEEESGCLGAAIQAMVAATAETAQPVTFPDAAAKLVAFDAAKSCHPRPEHRAAYNAARQRYGQTLAMQYPETSNSSSLHSFTGR